MGARTISVFDVHLYGGSLNELPWRAMVLLATSCWLFVTNCLLAVFRFITACFLRFSGQRSGGKDDCSGSEFLPQKDECSDDCARIDPAPEVFEFEKSDYDGFDDRETPKFSFKFQFDSPEEIRRRIEETQNSVSSPETNVHMYSFHSGKDLVGFVQEPEVLNLSVEYSYADSRDFSSDCGTVKKSENPDVQSLSEFQLVCFENPEVEALSEELELSSGSVTEFIRDDASGNREIQLLTHKDFLDSGSDLESLNSYIEFTINDRESDSTSDGLFSEVDCAGRKQEIWSDLDGEVEHSSDREGTHLQNPYSPGTEFIELVDGVPSLAISNSSEEQDQQVTNSLKTEEELGISEDDHSQQLESLWEHQDLIEQLRMELRKVRAIGLPTILEEPESPKTMEDLKSWKFEAQFLQEDPMDELQKLYKSYRERMRKFDILNYQKMYAIGFLQLKGPVQSQRGSGRQSSAPSLASLLSWRRRVPDDPSKKLIKELEMDLEAVYVGQTCLSWEFLQWQHGRAQELPASDPGKSRLYNQVAGEFQQFQVVLQRFLENEPFEERQRVQNYVRSRCVLRNLLQVPAIREDCFKDKKEERRRKKEDNGGITSSVLVDMIEESMRLLWEFIKADKDETALFAKASSGIQHPEFQDSVDSQLFFQVQADLHKKEKKLKECLRTGQCLVKRLQKHRTEASHQVVVFFAQVDVKLVARVLRMSKLSSDQLKWCQKKLGKITFSDRRLYREPSFLLFPC